MRRAARTDGTHAAIVKTLRAAGCFVVDLSRLGNGVPDLLVGYRGKWVVVEVKDGSRPPSERRLTDDEQTFHDLAKHHRLPCEIALGPLDALDILGLERI